MTDLEIYNSELEGQSIVDVYKSLIWERKYFEAGNFEIYAGADENNTEMLKIGNIIVKDGADESGKIDYVHIGQNQNEEGIFITAKGYFLSYILYKHVIRGTVTLTGSVELSMRKLVYDTVINVSDKYKIANLEFEEINGFEETFEGTVSYKDLYEYLVALSNVSGIGFRIRFYQQGGKYVFETYRAKDRSINQTVYPQIIFSQEYDNLLSSEYSADTTAEVNAVIARYKGQYGEVIVEVDESAGQERKEVYIEGDCVTQTIYTEGGSYEILDTEATKKSLTGLAKQQLKGIAENFEGNVDFNGSMIYKTDYDLGDVVTTFNDSWGISISDRIYSIQEVEDESGKQVTPTFGSPLPTILDILKG